MNISIDNGRVVLDLTVRVLHDEPLLYERGVEALLQQWCNSPFRSWAPLRYGSDGARYVIARTDENGRVQLDILEPTDHEAYSLSAIDRMLGEVLTWGEAIGESSPELQIATEKALQEVLNGATIPETYADLSALVQRVVRVVTA